MTKRANQTLRNLWAQGLIDTLGASHLIKFYDGTQPASTATALGTQVLLATLTADTTPGAVATGVLTFDAANYTQNNATHGNNVTPTWVSLQTAASVRVYEFAIPGDGMTFTGTIQTNVDINRGAWTWVSPDA